MADRSYKLTLSLSDGSTINAGTITAPQGPNGTNGATFIPSVSAAGVLSWTNNGGLTNPSPINIKGPKGDDAVITASDVENWGFTKNKGTVTSVAVKINGAIKGTVTSSGTIDLGTVLTEHQDISGKANLDGGNTFTGKQTLNSPASDGYSINAAGYVKGSWLQASAIANKGANTGKVCVFDNSGWIYYRTPAEILTEAGGAKSSDIPDISGKLDKTTYEVNKTINFGSSGVLYVGKFKVYDTNVTCEVTSTTNVTYSGKLVIATQNNVIQQMTVYGDAANTVAPNFFIKPSTTSDPYIEIYFKPASWSKNVIHIYGSAISAEPTNVCTNVSAVPSTATLKPTNALNSKANLSGGNTFVGQQTFDNDAYINGNLYNSSSMQTRSFSLTDDGLGGDEAISAGFSQNGTGFVEMGGTIECELMLKGNAGSFGQALLSQGASKTPIWGNVVSCYGPQTIIGNLTLAPEQTGYVLDCYNYNSNNNDTVFGVQIDEQETQYDKGIIRIGDGDAIAEVSLKNNVGSKGQVFTSNGPGQTPEWTSIEDKIKNYSSFGVHLKHMMFNIDKWSNKTWSGLTNFIGGYVWTDGDNIYYSNGSTQYVLNKSTSTWSTKTWSGLTNFNGNRVWTDGYNIYYSDSSTQYVLNKATSTWSAKTWSGLTDFTGNCVWTDGDNIYYSSHSKQYVLNKATSTWSTKTWSGLTSFYGGFVWTDGDNIYCVYNNKTYYVLNKSTSTWSTKTFSGGPGYISVDRIWTDGYNIYYSDSSTQYVLNKATSTWSAKTWSGLTNFIGGYVWTDSDNIYYSDGSKQYVLNKYKTRLFMQPTFN